MKLTVDQLLVEANRRLDGLDVHLPGSSRAGQRVDVRTFRHYRSERLVDPPHEKRGVAGLYGTRHLAQVVAIKVLQAQRHTLNEIRSWLADAGDAELDKMSRTTICSSTSAKTKRSRGSPPRKDRRWVQIQLSTGAFAMVDVTLIESSRPSQLRALGEQLSSHLLSLRT